mmetsp:Transcript_2891/g.6415  ORF Transcript_2891/g.6415 Transcript_2891/m.6415 type:complete len:227 (-) Transcript_2891:666-1346(-)
MKSKSRTSRQRKEAKKRRAANELDFSHNYAAPSVSSSRARAAAGAFLLADEAMSDIELANCDKVDDIMDADISTRFTEVLVGPLRPLKVEGHVMFKGGVARLPWINGCKIIPATDFNIVQPKSPTKGVRCYRHGSDNEVFCLLPRQQTLHASGVGDVKYCHVIVPIIDEVLMKVQKKSIERGCIVVCDGRYAGSFVVTVPLGKLGVDQFSYHLERLGEKKYNIIVE